MAVTNITVILSPYHVGIKDHRCGAGPSHIINHGLIKRLEDVGKHVTVHQIEPVDDYEGEIGRSFEVMRRVSKAVTAAHNQGRFPLVLAGNCNNTVGTVAGVRDGDEEVVWFDAHPDIDTPEDTTSGYFDVNGVSILAGQCWDALAHTIPGHEWFDLEMFTYVGIRDFNSEQQKAKARDCGATIIWGGREQPQEGFAKALARRLSVQDDGPTECIVHLDVDSLDTSVGIANHAAAPGGLSKKDLRECMKVIRESRRTKAMTVASFDPQFKGSDGIAEAAVAAILELVT